MMMCSATRIFTLASIILLAFSASAGGGSGGHATEYTQLLNNTQLLEQVKQQIKTYRTLMLDLEIAKRNIAPNSRAFMSRAGASLQRLHRALRRDGKIGRGTVNTLEQMDKQFPGYAEYLGNANPDQIPATYIEWDNRSRENVRRALELVDTNANELVTEGQLLRELQRHSQSTDGQLAAIQVGNEIAVAQLAQNQRLQQLLHTQIELQGNFYLQQQDILEHSRAVNERLSDTPLRPSRPLRSHRDYFEGWKRN